MVEGARTLVTEITWRNSTVLINRTLTYTQDETVSVSELSTDREVLWREAVRLQLMLDSAIIE